MKTNLIIAVVLISFVLLVFSIVSIVLQGSSEQKPEPLVSKTDFSKSLPGRSTPTDIIKINGEPSSKEIKEGKISFYYDTTHPDLKDIVVFEEGLLVYAIENIFDASELSLAGVKALGEYETYFSERSLFSWFVFEEKGIGVETDGKEILRVIYFVPSENFLVSNVAKELEISKESVIPEAPRP